MAHRKTERNPLFAGRWFEDDIILLCLRWYFRFKLSYRDLVVILDERGLSISHTTILRWVIRYAETWRWCMNRNWPATNPTHRSITYQERTTMAYRARPSG